MEIENRERDVLTQSFGINNVWIVLSKIRGACTLIYVHIYFNFLMKFQRMDM